MLENLAPSLTLDERVYGELRRAIVNSHLQPGQELVVTTVAEQLGVSRIPVMHACQRLAGEGFLVANPRRSFVVAPMTESRVAERFSVIMALECLAIEAAAQHVTDDDLREWTRLKDEARTFRREHSTTVQNVADVAFHTAIWDRANMPYVGHLLRVVFDHLEPARGLARPLNDPDASVAEHEQLLEALSRRDPEAAKEAIRRHRQRGMRVAIAAIQAARQAPRVPPIPPAQ
jgi:DNA-binding GntR family transcriptional regulator